MDNALSQVGLPVKCRHCDATALVKPGTDYNGWSRSRVTKKWSCPEHSSEGMDNSFKRRFSENTPIVIESEVVEEPTDELDKLYELLD